MIYTYHLKEIVEMEKKIMNQNYMLSVHAVQG